MRRDIEELIAKEGDGKEFEYKGYKCEIWRHPTLLHLCGYVKLPEFHELWGKSMNELDNLDCHGGITFSEMDKEMDKESLKIGFDCGHYLDYTPGTPVNFPNSVYRDINYVESEIKKLVDQVVLLRNAKG